jgi:hypothetical protein
MFDATSQITFVSPRDHVAGITPDIKKGMHQRKSDSSVAQQGTAWNALNVLNTKLMIFEVFPIPTASFQQLTRS